MSNYELNIISHHKDFAGKTLKKHHVEGIPTIGAYGNEEYSIVFKNNTFGKVSVIISIDGTSILTGKPATTDPSEKMWVVNGYSSLTLKCWPESSEGGAAFVFTNTANGVATHTHGDLSSQGIIAAAVFVEGQVPEPTKWVVVNPYIVYPSLYPIYREWWQSPNIPWWNNGNQITCGGGSYTTNGNVGPGSSTIVNNCFSAAQHLESSAATGAGEFKEQTISYVAGLIKPVFTETVRVRYLWWSDLVEKLKSHNAPTPHASGFPGDKNIGINLGSTPRLSNYGNVRRAEPVQYSRV
jgi:hypothetical protein